MDDIDRTFNALKRTEYSKLVEQLINYGPVVNPSTFEMGYTRHAEAICIRNGWTVEELNKEFQERLIENYGN